MGRKKKRVNILCPENVPCQKTWHLTNHPHNILQLEAMLANIFSPPLIGGSKKKT
jgi:hypothetical protein